jgi:hypothetical protein
MAKSRIPPPGAPPEKRVSPPNMDRARRGILEVQQAVERMRVTVDDARQRLDRAYEELDEIRRKLPSRPDRRDPGSAAQ